MIAYLTLEEVLSIHATMVARYGGDPGILDIGAIDSALAQPRQGFGGQDFYPSIAEKAAALAYFISKNHGFVDGNKRAGFGAMDTFLRSNGFKVVAPIDELETAFLGMTANKITREEFFEWVRKH